MKGMRPTLHMVVKPTCKNCPVVLMVLFFSHASLRRFRIGMKFVSKPTRGNARTTIQKNEAVLTYRATLPPAAQLKPRASRLKVKIEAKLRIASKPAGHGTATVFRTPKFWNKATSIPKAAVVDIITLALAV